MNDPAPIRGGSVRRQAETPADTTPSRPAPSPSEPTYDRIVCAGCGRWFTTIDGPGMLAAIKGPCPDCGAAFELSTEPPRSDVSG
jgi:hypothetical protein